MERQREERSRTRGSVRRKWGVGKQKEPTEEEGKDSEKMRKKSDRGLIGQK